MPYSTRYGRARVPPNGRNRHQAVCNTCGRNFKPYIKALNCPECRKILLSERMTGNTYRRRGGDAKV